jgi:hypothetical protein
MRKKYSRIALSLLIFLPSAITATYFILRLAPTERGFFAIIFSSLIVSVCLYRLIALPWLIAKEYKFLLVMWTMLLVSGVAFVVFKIQRPYTLMIWAIGWQIFAIILAFNIGKSLTNSS